MKLKTLVLVGGTIASTSLLASERPTEDRVPVFVRSEQTVGGFTDPDKHRQDSVKDLQKKIKDSKTMVLVEAEKDAVMLVEVLGRETKRETNLWGQQNKSYVGIRLTAGEYHSEMTGESSSKGVMSGYGDAAGKIVKQLDAWVAANRDRLTALKNKPAATGTEAPKP